MVFAKDMRQVVDQIQGEKRQKQIEKTRQFCHSTLSKMIEEKAYKGIDYIDLHITTIDKEGICRVLEKDGETGIWVYKESLIWETVKEILSDHAYNYHMFNSSFDTQDNWRESGLTVHISW